MPLGKQFRNTYWHDEDGKVRAAQENRSLPGEPAGTRPIIHELPDNEKPEKNLQGMLFDPYTGTGLRQDPTVDPEHRRQAIKDSLGLNDVEKYRQRLGSMIPSQTIKNYERDEDGNRRTSITSKRGSKAAKEDMELITDTLDNTDMPTHLIKRTSAPAVLDPRAGRAFAEDYSGRIRLTTDTTTRLVRTPGQKVTRPKVERGEPLENKRFHEQVNNIDWGSEEGAHSSMVGGGDFNENADVHFWNRDTGEKVELDGDNYSQDFRGAGPRLHANVWPGTGKDTAKYVTQQFKVYNGMSWNGGGDRHRTFHTRHALVNTGETETIQTPDTVKKVTSKSTSAPTIVHELGHVRDPHTADPFSARIALNHRADPIEEGLADGHADRFARHAGMYEETLHPEADGRIDEIMGKSGGYGVDYHHWRGNAVGKALYVAARSHAAMGDDNVAQMRSRGDIGKQFGIESPSAWDRQDAAADRVKSVNTLLLGQMYHDHPHVRTALHLAGMEKVAKSAHEEYLSRTRVPEPETGWEQPDMFEEHERQTPKRA